jgi:hypothetical protein
MLPSCVTGDFNTLKSMQGFGCPIVLTRVAIWAVGKTPSLSKNMLLLSLEMIYPMEFVCMVGNVDKDFSSVLAVTFIVDCDDDLVIKIYSENLD